ncbi:MAG: hypothetical protein U0136_07070 [Bdellovibrionota bacterium]
MYFARGLFFALSPQWSGANTFASSVSEDLAKNRSIVAATPASDQSNFARLPMMLFCWKPAALGIEERQERRPEA